MIDIGIWRFHIRTFIGKFCIKKLGTQVNATGFNVSKNRSIVSQHVFLTKMCYFRKHDLCTFFTFQTVFICFLALLLLCGDIEMNPGPVYNDCGKYYMCTLL